MKLKYLLILLPIFLLASGCISTRVGKTIVYTCDSSFLFLLSEEAKTEEIYAWVDHLAKDGGVDIYSQMTFSEGWVILYKSRFCESDTREKYNRLDSFFALGVDPINLFIERSHHNGMEFMANFRMNDRHGHNKEFLEEHKEWLLEEFPRGVDYSIPEVRDWMFSIMKEVAEKFDVDGLELDFVRWGHVFPTSIARKNQPIMTEFISSVRGMLDRVSEEKGKRLKLGVRVPQTLEECHILGYDVPTWIQEGLIDYICPSDFLYTDFNAPYEEFAELTKGSSCKLYPTIHPLVAEGHDKTLMSLPMYRAAARNFYSYGADGISVFNYQYNWAKRQDPSYPGPAEMYPEALTYLRELKDPEIITKGDRYYVFYSLRMGTNTGVIKQDRIVLTRGESGAYDQLEFRIAEGFEEGTSLLLRFNAIGLLPEDEIIVYLNGIEIDPDKIKRTYHEEGREEGKEGKPLPAYSSCEFALTSPPAVQGKNILGVRLIKSALEPLTVDSCVLWLALNEGSGVSAVDSSGYGNNGAIEGASWVSGPSGWALSFEGEEDYVNCGDNESLDITEAITIEAWVKTTTGGGIVVKRGEPDWEGYSLYIHEEDNRIGFFTTGVSPDRISCDATAIRDGNWHHLVGTYDGSSQRIYQDDVVVASQLATGSIDTTVSRLFIGARDRKPGVVDLYFKGLLGEVRIYNRALNAIVMPEIEVGVSVSGKSVTEIMIPGPPS